MRTALLHPERPQMAPSFRSFGEHLPWPGASRTSLPRQNSPPLAAAERIGDWVLDRRACTVQITVQPSTPALCLTECEFSLTTALFHELGRPVSRSRLQGCASLHEDIDSAHTLDSHLDRLERKLQAHGRMGIRLQRLYGHGYRLMRTGQSVPDPLTTA